MKRILSLILACLILLFVVGCGSQSAASTPATAAPTAAPVPTENSVLPNGEPVLGNSEFGLLEGEKENLDVVGDDLTVVTDESFPRIVSEIYYHVGEYDGQVFQMDGVLLHENNKYYLFRALDNAGKVTEIRLPLNYVLKDIPGNTWIRVTGVVNSDSNGSVLDIVAMEALQEVGQVTLPWTGHHHG